MSISRLLAFLILGCAPFAGNAADGNDGTLLISVDVIQLNNRQEPNGYGQELLEFKVKNLETGKRYAKPPTPHRYPAALKLPAGTYCVYSVKTPLNRELTYCDQPYIVVTAGQVNNAGKWRFGLSYEAGTFGLLHAFQSRDVIDQQARKRYPGLFKQAQADGSPDP